MQSDALDWRSTMSCTRLGENNRPIPGLPDRAKQFECLGRIIQRLAYRFPRTEGGKRIVQYSTEHYCTGL